MKVVAFGFGNYGKTLLSLINSCPIQSGINLTAYFHSLKGGGTNELVIYRWQHNVNINDAEKIFEEISEIKIQPNSFDKIYIVGANFDLRQQLFKMGVEYKKISMCYGDIIHCHCPLDEIFVIPKAQPEVPFKKGPAEIYQNYTGETAKSHARRVREKFFEKYCQGEGLDIGYGADIIDFSASGWDLRNGDAQYLAGIEDESFDYVYSSHCLEHMYDVRIALKNWFRVVRKGGYLLLAIPHRDLYEKKNQLPSLWNGDHKHMFLIGRAEPPDTLDICEEIRESISNYDIKYIKACDEGHTITNPLVHSDGEYQIEVVIQKL